jgi:polyribonucleotide nucleotidyltransferase
MVQRFETLWGGKKLIIETGKLAPQTNASCTVQYGETVVLSTVVMSSQARAAIDYFPLMVDFEEKLYAAGKIKGSRFIKREGRASDEAVLSGRLVDRSIRPLFNEKIRNDVQVINTVLSFDTENDPDVLSLIGASCALAISDIPWDGPIAGIRVGRAPAGEGEWVVNPSYEIRDQSDLDLIIAGTTEKVIMIEVGAEDIPGDVMLEAMKYGQKHLKTVINVILDSHK